METEKKVSIHSLLTTKYPENEYALLYEVRDDSGFKANRSADAIAVNLWPSRGHSITGFEIKVSRSDWLSELKKPQKAEAIMKYCNFWNLVVEDESVIKEDEIPKAWGLLIRKGNRLFTKKKAPELTPEQPSLGFIASMLKRATQGKGMIPTTDIQHHIDSAVKLAEERERNTVRRIRDSLENDIKELRKILHDFKEASGLDLRHDYLLRDSKKVGDAVNFVLNGGIENLKRELQKISDIHLAEHKKIELLLNDTIS